MTGLGQHKAELKDQNLASRQKGHKLPFVFEESHFSLHTQFSSETLWAVPIVISNRKILKALQNHFPMVLPCKNITEEEKQVLPYSSACCGCQQSSWARSGHGTPRAFALSPTAAKDAWGGE